MVVSLAVNLADERAANLAATKVGNLAGCSADRKVD